MAMLGPKLLHGWTFRIRRSACTVLTTLAFIYFGTGILTMMSGRPGLNLVQRSTTQVQTFISNLLQIVPRNTTIKEIDMAERFIIRQNQVRSVCSVLMNDLMFNRTSSSGMGISYVRRNVTYCAVPKAGCTFWKQIFRFANREYVGNLTSPFDIKRHEVHYPSVPVKSKFLFKKVNTIPDLANSFKFTFVRDPYTRLWSAYLDKFVLPDFWRTYAKDVVRKVRRNPTNHSLLCADDVTFEEFLTYVVKTEKKGRSANEHWQPIYKICNPCEKHFDAIGTQETFSSDSKFILSKFGLEHVLENRDFSGHVEDELSMLVKYNFDLKSVLPKKCFDENLIAQRIWKVFQANAYLILNSTFPVNPNDSTKSLTGKDVTNIVLKEFRERGIPKTLWKQQRRDIMAAAYKQIPMSVLKELQNVYRADFQLFGYKAIRQDLYGKR